MSLGNKEVMSNNLKYYMDKKGVDRNQLCSDLDLKYMTVSDWINAKTYPRIDKIELLANYFGINKSDLIEEKSTIPSTTPQTVSDDVLRLDRDLHSNNHKSWIRYGNTLLDKQNTVNEPHAVYHTYNYYDQPASAGTGQYLNDVKVETIELPIEVDADFVVPIYGDSMEPEYHSGDYIFVKLSVDLSDGDIGVFAYNGDAYIKQLRITDQGAYLHSLNPDYDNIPITADTDFRTIGEVVDIYRG
ncbi:MULTISPECIES: LexA family transcriptional regulator [Streptococcus]|uniref:LexA family transcriptional regulator n=1 Tax=Streptococcus TaxID=1301 RepID=UPI00201A9D84|nr:XRE family transcriptional regulator [Streptococcus suis]MCL4922067.1 XRE family transcriptional regulator [Streptococcus suis]